MAKTTTCDGCGKPITAENPIEYKVFLAPVYTGKTRSTHSDYTHHMDIGACCTKKVVELGHWQLRRKQQRQNGAGRAVAASKRRKASTTK